MSQQTRGAQLNEGTNEKMKDNTPPSHSIQKKETFLWPNSA